MATSKKSPKTTAKRRPTKKTPAKKQAVASGKWWLTTKFARIYGFASFIILLLTTGLWSLLSARLQQGNADQLVNTYLLESPNTFHNALLPGQHSFLLKWPVFGLVHLMGATGRAMIGVTVFVTLLTVAGFAYILYRIDRRPVVFGTLCLALASVLLIVPAQPYAGALLPVNMAMLATRNLEYILYIGGLVALIRWHEVKSWGFWLAVLCLGVVIASDQLFFTMSIGGAVLALGGYVFMRRWKLAQLSIKWVLASVFAAAAAGAMIWLIVQTGITHVSSQSSVIYGLQHDLRRLAQGVIYAVFAVVTNLGANPAYDGIVLRNVPHLLRDRLLSIGGFSFITNLAIMVFMLFSAGKLFIASLLPGSKHPFHEDRASSLSLMLLWASLAAVGAFVVSNHYYAVDARYLTISLFALFVAGATYCRSKQWPAQRLLIIGGVITVSIGCGTIFSVKTHQVQASALKESNDRNSLIAQALSHHPVDVLVGDYWRVIPTKQTTSQKLNVMPLSACSQVRDLLSSTVWQPNLQKTKFAYLLSLDKGLTDYPACSLDQVVELYGHPNASAVIAGTLDNPREVLLFYDQGAHQTTNTAAKPPATVVPIPIEELPNVSCAGPTIMNVVAHEDDDLLFMNPDLLHDIKAGRCVRTVYVTAGDAGSGQFYWLAREQGSQAAYGKMIGDDHALWVQRVVKLGDKAFMTVANPRNNPKVSLIFLRLPDGNLAGQGFNSSHHESLERLYDGQLATIQSVTKQSAYSAQQLTAALVTVMQTYQPAEIRTQSNTNGHVYPDHSDHMAVGRFTEQAYTQYEQTQYENKVIIPFKAYLGYPGHELPQNVFGADLEAKTAAFLAYATFDGGVCQNMAQCSHTSTYDAYLKRQYERGK